MPNESLTFRNQPVTITLGDGPTAKSITVKDLPYPRHKELLSKLSDIFLERAAFPQMVEQLGRETQKMVIMQNKTADELGDIFMDKVKDLYMHLSDANVRELFLIVTDGQVGESEIDSFSAGEVIGCTKFLVDRNLVALKNLFASLDDTQMQPKDKK